MMFKKRTNAKEAKELFLNSFQPVSKIENLPLKNAMEG